MEVHEYNPAAATHHPVCGDGRVYPSRQQTDKTSGRSHGQPSPALLLLAVDVRLVRYLDKYLKFRVVQFNLLLSGFPHNAAEQPVELRRGVLELLVRTACRDAECFCRGFLCHCRDSFCQRRHCKRHFLGNREAGYSGNLPQLRNLLRLHILQYYSSPLPLNLRPGEVLYVLHELLLEETAVAALDAYLAVMNQYTFHTYPFLCKKGLQH